MKYVVTYPIVPKLRPGEIPVTPGNISAARASAEAEIEADGIRIEDGALVLVVAGRAIEIFAPGHWEYARQMEDK